MQKKKGISLIVLSITILVMAILAATAIIALEDTGIIKRSKDTVKNSNYSDEYTRLIVIKNGIITDNLGTITVDEYVLELQNKSLIESTVTTNSDGSKTVITKTGFTVIISQNGTSDLKIVIDGYTPSTNTSNGNNAGNNSSGNSGELSDGGYITAGDQLQGKWYMNESVTWDADVYNFEFGTCEHFAIEPFVRANLKASSSVALRSMIPMSGSPIKYFPNGEWPESDGCSHVRTWLVRSTIDEVTNTSDEAAGQELYEWLCANATRTDLEEISFYVDGVEYKTMEGMIWEEWIASGYNTGGFVISSDNTIMQGTKTLYREDTSQCPGATWLTFAWNYVLT